MRDPEGSLPVLQIDQFRNNTNVSRRNSVAILNRARRVMTGGQNQTRAPHAALFKVSLDRQAGPFQALFESQLFGDNALDRGHIKCAARRNKDSVEIEAYDHIGALRLDSFTCAIVKPEPTKRGAWRRERGDQVHLVSARDQGIAEHRNADVSAAALLNRCGRAGKEKKASQALSIMGRCCRTYKMRNHALEAVTSYYHKILPFYEGENEERPDLEFWRVLAAERKPRNVLELGAGSGRVTASLTRLAPVVGIDLSHEMLRSAAARLAAQSNSFPAALVNADMRRFAFACRFDLIVAPNDPFSHLTQRKERQLALRGIARHLTPGGMLVIEGLYRPERKRIEMPEHSAGGVSIRESWQPFGRDNRWRARYAYQRGQEHVEAEFVARSWDLPEANILLNGYGLELKEIWGDFDRRAFSPDAQRMILIAELPHLPSDDRAQS